MIPRFNAAVPFLIVVITTLVGMIMGGRQAILDQPEERRMELTIVNIFTMADSVSALIWASFLASAVLFVMLRLQKILKLSEFMEVHHFIFWSLSCKIFPKGSGLLTLHVYC